MLYIPNKRFIYSLGPLKQYLLENGYDKKYKISCGNLDFEQYGESKWIKTLAILKSMMIFLISRHVFYTMSGIQHEKNRKDISFLQKIKNVNAIENTTEIVNAVKDYPIRELPIKWKIYTFLLKHNLLRFTFFFVVK